MQMVKPGGFNSMSQKPTFTKQRLDIDNTKKQVQPKNPNKMNWP